MGRIKWIDFNRGLLILLVVMAHSFCPEILFSYISYILPGFLFLSGFLYKDRPFLKTLRKLFLTLAIPYLIAGSINIIIWFVTKPLIPVPENDFTLSEVIINFLFVRTEAGQTAANLIPIWFLSLLFFTEVFYALLKKAKLVLPAVIFGIISVNFYDGPLLWKLDVVPVALVFFFFGILWRSRNGLKGFEKPVITFLVSVSIFAAIVNLNGLVDMNADYYGKIPLLFYPAGICVILIFTSLSQLFENSKISGYFDLLGTNTIFILAYHITAAAMLYPLFDYFGDAIEIATNFWYIFFLMEMGLLTIMILFIPGKLRAFLSGELFSQKKFTSNIKQDFELEYKSLKNPK